MKSVIQSRQADPVRQHYFLSQRMVRTSDIFEFVNFHWKRKGLKDIRRAVIEIRFHGGTVFPCPQAMYTGLKNGKSFVCIKRKYRQFVRKDISIRHHCEGKGSTYERNH